jgi:hypothetical protein
MHLLTLEFKRIVEMVKGMVASARERERERMKEWSLLLLDSESCKGHGDAFAYSIWQEFGQ